MPLAPASIDRQGPFNVDLIRGQDMDFSLRLRKTGGRMLLVPDVASEYYARSTISAFWRQNWNNGLWAMLPFAYTDGVPVSLRHLIPLFFVTALLAAKAAFEAGERNGAKLVEIARKPLAGVDSVQYLELVDTQNLEPIQGPVDRSAALCVAAYVGSTRLIDNVLLSPPASDLAGSAS